MSEYQSSTSAFEYTQSSGWDTFVGICIIAYAVGHAPIAIAAADFNGDGKLDLAVANSTDYTVSILLQQ